MPYRLRIYGMDIAIVIGTFLATFIVSTGLFIGCIAWSTALLGHSAWWLGLLLGILSMVSIGSSLLYWDIVRSEKQRAAKELKSRITFYYAPGDPFTRIY